MMIREEDVDVDDYRDVSCMMVMMMMMMMIIIMIMISVMMMMIMIMVMMIGYTCAVVDTIRKPSREKRAVSMLLSVEVKIFILSYRCGFMLMTILMMIMMLVIVVMMMMIFI